MDFKEKKCAYPGCKKEFKPKGPRARFCEATHEETCVDCSGAFLAPSTSLGAKETCRKCSFGRAKVNREKTMEERYGSKNALQNKEILEKARKTLKTNYGVDNPMKSEKVKDRHKDTVRKNYGVDFPTQSDRVKETIRATNLKNHGVDNPMKNSEIKEKAVTNFKKAHGKAENPEGYKKRMDKTVRTNQKLYGANFPLQNEALAAKASETLKSNFGVETPFKSKVIREKSKKKLLENHGVDNPMKSDEIKKRASATVKEKYGVDHFMANESIKKKVRKTMEERYGESAFFKTEEFKEKSRLTNIARSGFPYASQDPLVKERISKAIAENAKLNKNYLSGRISKVNRFWAKFLEESLSTPVSFEPSMGSGFAADLEIGKVLIEINPSFTHNSHIAFGCVLSNCEESNCEKHRPTAKDRHFKRAQVALEEDIPYIQIYDWDEPEKILKFLRGKLERGWRHHSARKLEVRSISVKEANLFLEENHIQGGVRGQTHRYGLLAEGELLAVATFGPDRFKSKASHEWLRYVVKQGHIVHGGAGRLWQVFLSEASPSSVISYIDFDHSTRKNTFFSSIEGWVEAKPTGPAKVWSKKEKRIYNNSLIRQGADRLLGTTYGSREESGLNNEQIMLLEGWLPVYTAGNRVFTWQSDSSLSE